MDARMTIYTKEQEDISFGRWKPHIRRIPYYYAPYPPHINPQALLEMPEGYHDNASDIEFFMAMESIRMFHASAVHKDE